MTNAQATSGMILLVAGIVLLIAVLIWASYHTTCTRCKHTLSQHDSFGTCWTDRKAGQTLCSCTSFKSGGSDKSSVKL